MKQATIVGLVLGISIVLGILAFWGSSLNSRTDDRSGASEPSRDRASNEVIGWDELRVFEQTGTPARLRAARPAWFRKIPTIEARKNRVSGEVSNSPVREGEADADASHPDEALAFRELQLKDENGEVPLDGLLKAREHMDRMRAYAAQQARAGGPGFAGLAPADWRWLGPGNIGGRVRSIVIDPANANNLLIGSVSGGIWRTTDTGNTWQPIDDFMASLSVSTMVRNPINANEILAGTGEAFANLRECNFDCTKGVRGAGIFRSTDAGTTWSQIPSTNPAAPSPPGCDTIGGVPCPPTWRYVKRLAFSPDGLTILAATHNGIMHSTDGGATWLKRTNVNTLDIDFRPGNSLQAIAGELGQAQYTADGGQTWTASVFTPPITPITNGTGRVELAYAPSLPNAVYASVDNNNGEVYLSTNGGVSFNQVNTGNSLLGGQGGYDNIIWVNPFDPNFVIVGGVALWRSTDSGQNFTQISMNSTSSAHSDHHMIMASAGFNNSSDKSVYFATDGGIFRADDVSTVAQTSGWTHRNHRLGITQFYSGAVSATGTVIGGTQDNGTARVLPAPNLDPPYDTESWDEYAKGDGGFVAADPADENYLYSSYTNLTIQRSTNGGASASYVYCNPMPSNPNGGICNGTGILDAQNGANFVAPFILDPNNANTMLAGGLSLWRSNDIKSPGLPNWTAVKPQATPVPSPTPSPSPSATPTPTPAPVAISAIAVAKGNSDLVFVGHNDGQIYVSQDATGTIPSWTRVNNGTPSRFVTRLTIDDNHSPVWVYATFGGFTNNNVWVSKDLGATWSDVSGATGSATDLPAVPVRSLVINEVDSKKIYVGTEVGIFASVDAGATWQLPQGGPANVPVDELFWFQGDLFAATHGRGIYKTAVPVIDFARCAVGGSSPIPCPPGQSYCRFVNPPNGGCCRIGDWHCPCTWASGQIPTQDLDVSISCPVSVQNAGPAVARNMYVGNRLTLNQNVTLLGDVTNVGLIESGQFSGGLTLRNLTNIRPGPAVTNAGIITLNNPLNVSGDISNYGIISGSTINLNNSGAPSTFVHTISGNGFWGNSSMNIGQTAELGSNVTVDVGTLVIGSTASLKLNGYSLTVNRDLTNAGRLDIGTGTLNFRGSNFGTSNPFTDPNYGVIGTGTITLAPTNGSANFSVLGGLGGVPVVFQPALRVVSGTINANVQSPLSGTFTIDPGAIFNFNQGTIDMNGGLVVNGAMGKTTSPSITTTLNFNGATLTNNGSMFVDFLYFNNTGSARMQSINGTGAFGGTSAQIGLGGSPSNMTLTGFATFNQGQLSVGSGSSVDLGIGNALTFTGSSFLNAGNITGGTGTLVMQPSGASSTLSGIGSYSFASRIRIASGSVTPSIRTTGSFEIDPGATLNGGSLLFYGPRFTNNGSVVSTSLVFGSLNFLPINQQMRGTGTYSGPSGQLWVRSESTTTLLNDVTYAGPRLYLEGLINTDIFTWTMPCTTLFEGTGEIIGTIRRSNLAACPGAAFAFGSPFTTIRFTSGTPPTDIAVNVIRSAPVGFPTAAQRTYVITPLGGSGYTATLRLHYLDSELNGNNETMLQLWRNDGTNWTMQGVSSRNTVDNWVEYNGVTQFSPWAISELAPTAANVSISGRVLTASGMAISRASLTLTDAAGNVSVVHSNNFGHFRFDEVAAGQTVVLHIRAKGHVFQNPTLVLNVKDEISDIEFIAE